jgi:hypothetical protein
VLLVAAVAAAVLPATAQDFYLDLSLRGRIDSVQVDVPRQVALLRVAVDGDGSRVATLECRPPAFAVCASAQAGQHIALEAPLRPVVGFRPALPGTRPEVRYVVQRDAVGRIFFPSEVVRGVQP